MSGIETDRNEWDRKRERERGRERDREREREKIQLQQITSSHHFPTCTNI